MSKLGLPLTQNLATPSPQLSIDSQSLITEFTGSVNVESAGAGLKVATCHNRNVPHPRQQKLSPRPRLDVVAHEFRSPPHF